MWYMTYIGINGDIKMRLDRIILMNLTLLSEKIFTPFVELFYAGYGIAQIPTEMQTQMDIIKTVRGTGGVKNHIISNTKNKDGTAIMTVTPELFDILRYGKNRKNYAVIEKGTVLYVKKSFYSGKNFIQEGSKICKYVPKPKVTKKSELDMFIEGYEYDPKLFGGKYIP